MSTDDYDGHTPGPWRIEYEYGEGQDEMSGGRTYICGKNATIIWQCETTHADAELVAAAPDLLAEVNRLREAVSLLFNSVTQYSEKDAWYVAEVKRLKATCLHHNKVWDEMDDEAQHEWNAAADRLEEEE